MNYQCPNGLMRLFIVGGLAINLQFGLARPAAGQVPAQVENNNAGEDAELADEPASWMLQSYARVNAGLARRACTLTAAEDAQLALMTSSWLAQQIRNKAQSPVNGIAVGIARFLKGGRVEQADEQPQAVVARVKPVIDNHIEKSLTPEHLVAYRAERQAREQFRNEAQAGVLVASLDERLFLSPEQRQSLKTEIAQWLKKELYWQFYFQNQNYIPNIPRNILTKVLTAEQLDSLKGAREIQYELAQIELQVLQAAPPLIDQ